MRRPAAGPTSASPPDLAAAARNVATTTSRSRRCTGGRPRAQILQGADPARDVPGAPVHHRLAGPPPTRRAISAFGSPSAASSTIRARCANPARTVEPTGSTPPAEQITGTQDQRRRNRHGPLSRTT